MRGYFKNKNVFYTDMLYMSEDNFRYHWLTALNEFRVNVRARNDIS